MELNTLLNCHWCKDGSTGLTLELTAEPLQCQGNWGKWVTSSIIQPPSGQEEQRVLLKNKIKKATWTALKEVTGIT